MGILSRKEELMIGHEPDQKKDSGFYFLVWLIVNNGIGLGAVVLVLLLAGTVLVITGVLPLK